MYCILVLQLRSFPNSESPVDSTTGKKKILQQSPQPYLGAEEYCMQLDYMGVNHINTCEPMQTPISVFMFACILHHIAVVFSFSLQ